jgi:DNA repair exonuclease SbcCD ATPase subunit
VSALRAEVSGLAKARQKLQEAEQIQQKWDNLRAQESASRQNLARLQTELPRDRDAVRQEHVELENTDKTLEKSLAASRNLVKEVEKEIEKLTREREKAQTAATNLETEIKKAEVEFNHARQTIQKTQKLLPASWQTEAETVGMNSVFTLENEKTDLEASGVEERGKQLQQARANHDLYQQDLTNLEARQAEFPAEAGQAPAVIANLLETARRADRDCDEQLNQVRQQRALLESYRRQRGEIGAEYLATENELGSLRLLAELLGRDRLQLYLVRQAERQVVEYANAVLDRLSGGKLYLRLSGEANGEGAQAKALELEAYNRGAGEKPINVAFLSGSQKFRVAVSLALGIGQYASHQHRPIESVIIDEGFGCLDSQGRQVMIQELQNLRSQMRCILLVSHQEEFAEAFSDGYHFQISEGATRITRFQK